MVLPKCYFDISIGGNPAGRVVMEVRCNEICELYFCFGSLGKNGRGVC